MDTLLLTAPWLMTGAAIVSAAACIAARRSVPWQGMQTALIMAAVMLIIAAAHGEPMVSLILGAVLVMSAMVGTMGVRGKPAAAACCHRALGSLVMAICSFESVAMGEVGEAGAAGEVAAAGGHGHGQALSGVLPVLVIVGVIAVVAWTIVAEWFVERPRHGRTARFLSAESWAMAAGVAAMCVG